MAILNTLGKNIATVGRVFNLPEMGISERLSGSTAQNQPYINPWNQTAGSVLGAGTQQMYGGASWNNQSNFTPASTVNVTNKGGGGGGGGGFQYPQPNLISPSQPLGGGPSQVDVINSQFNDYNSSLDQQGSQAQSAYDQTMGLYNTQKSNAEQQLTTEKATQTEGIKKNESLNLSKVRQLLSDLQQGNAARTAITGGGSTSDVLAERFGRESQARMGNVMDQTQQALTRVNDFYNQSIQKLNESYQTNVMQAQQTLNDNLSQIRAARNANSAQKQGATVDAWKGYYDQLNNAKNAADQFQMQYDLWKQQMDQQMAAVQPFNTSNADVLNQGIAQSTSSTPQAPGVQNQQLAYQTNPLYKVKKKTPNDQEYWQQNFGFTPSYNTIG
jgi:hypothetical protein